MPENAGEILINSARGSINNAKIRGDKGQPSSGTIHDREGVGKEARGKNFSSWECIQRTNSLENEACKTKFEQNSF